MYDIIGGNLGIIRISLEIFLKRENHLGPWFLELTLVPRVDRNKPFVSCVPGHDFRNVAK